MRVWAENELSMEVLSLSKSALQEDDCVMELCGQWLAYRVSLRGCFVSLHSHSMDRGEEPILLLTVGDDQAGWRIICPGSRKSPGSSFWYAEIGDVR